MGPELIQQDTMPQQSNEQSNVLSNPPINVLSIPPINVLSNPPINVVSNKSKKKSYNSIMAELLKPPPKEEKPNIHLSGGGQFSKLDKI